MKKVHVDDIISSQSHHLQCGYMFLYGFYQKYQKKCIVSYIGYITCIIISILGHDTTTSAMSWILYELAKHPHFQKSCQDEIDKVMENNKGYVTWYVIFHSTCSKLYFLHFVFIRKITEKPFSLHIRAKLYVYVGYCFRFPWFSPELLIASTCDI